MKAPDLGSANRQHERPIWLGAATRTLDVECPRSLPPQERARYSPRRRDSIRDVRSRRQGGTKSYCVHRGVVRSRAWPGPSRTPSAPEPTSGRVIVSDVAMPGLDGYDFIRELRKHGVDTDAVVAVAARLAARG